MKRCSMCDEKKPRTQFFKQSAAKDGLQSRCKECSKATRRRWTQEDPRRQLAYQLRNKYGMELEEYERRLEEQGGVCAICGQAETVRLNQYEITRLAVDHCHETGAVRGLLCTHCNKALGLLKDDPARLRAALEYLSC